MFSKSKINEPGPKAAENDAPKASEPAKPTTTDTAATAPKAKPAPSVLSSDLLITGNLKTTGDIKVEGQVEGDIRAHLLTVGEGATVKGEVIADDVVVNGRIVGRVRGLALSASADRTIRCPRVRRIARPLPPIRKLATRAKPLTETLFRKGAPCGAFFHALAMVRR